jgi:hypothetical protein
MMRCMQPNILVGIAFIQIPPETHNLSQTKIDIFMDHVSEQVIEKYEVPACGRQANIKFRNKSEILLSKLEFFSVSKICILRMRVCFGFRISCFEFNFSFMRNRYA